MAAVVDTRVPTFEVRMRILFGFSCLNAYNAQDIPIEGMVYPTGMLGPLTANRSCGLEIDRAGSSPVML